MTQLELLGKVRCHNGAVDFAAAAKNPGRVAQESGTSSVNYNP
ncbi:MAG: hypothetical protein WAM69_08075 [Candidatus Sulfotelmatobacter sp.]